MKKSCTDTASDLMTEYIGKMFEAFAPVASAEASTSSSTEAPAELSTAAACAVSFVCRAASKRELLAAIGDEQHVIIQATLERKTSFYAYNSADSVNNDAAALLECKHVRELIDPRFQRRGFADIDSRNNDSDSVTAECRIVFGDELQTYATTKGVHVVGAQWMTRADHRTALTSLDGSLEGVDCGAISSLRLAGTWDKASSKRKEIPSGMRLYDTLIQPLGAPLDDTTVRFDAANTHFAGTADEAAVAAGVDALTDSPNSLSVVAIDGDRVSLSRVTSSTCNICKRAHDRIGAFLIITPGEHYARAYCYGANARVAALTCALKCPALPLMYLRSGPVRYRQRRRP